MKGIAVAVVLFSVVFLSGCPGVGGPEVIVEGINGTDEFGLTDGCYSTVSAYVKNTGSGTAENAFITCSTTQEGAIFATESSNLGSISSGSRIPFTMYIDTDCFKGEVSYDCVASCANC